MAEAKVSVRSDLLKIADDLKIIGQTANETAESLGDATKKVGKTVDDQVAIVNGGMKKLQNIGKELTKQLASDFKALFSVNALTSGLKLNDQFVGAVKEAVKLNDVMRNLAPIFGMNEAHAERFKRSMLKNLNEIGIGSEAAASALGGLSQTGVRGDSNLTEYARTSSELASVSRQKGQEGEIAKGLAKVVVAQGGNLNNPTDMRNAADDVVRIRNATGKSATEALAMLDKLFSSANSDFKKQIGRGGGVSIASAGLMGGEGSTAFLERYMGMNDKARAGMEAQGLGKLIGKNGSLNSDAFQSTVSEAKRRGGGNAEFGLTTFGMTDEEAKGFLRLADAMKQNGQTIERARAQVVDLNAEYRSTMGLGDAFRANINKVKGNLLPNPDILNKVTGTLSKASQSDMGSAAIVGGSALMAAMLTSKGMGGIGSLIFGEAKSKAIEGITGEKVQKVDVVNWPTSMAGAWSPWGDIAKKTGGAAAGGAAATTGIGLPMAAGALGIGVGLTAADQYEKYIKENPNSADAKGYKADVDVIRVLAQAIGLLPATVQGRKDVHVVVDSKDKSLKAYPKGSRGATQ